MATQSIPQIPPRPSRAHAHENPTSTLSGSTLGSDLPKIPPRPINKRLDRSVSPHRDSYARSPLNEPTFVVNGGDHRKSSLYNTESAEISAADLPRRPPSVSLPSIGQEGSEYAEVFTAAGESATSEPQKRSIANDLHLHAPKPSLPSSTTKQRVSAVTRTDSGDAAALGIGRASSDDKDPHIRSLKTKPSFASQSSGTERPPSSAENESGPDVGVRVPMYPNAGYVQAPSPSPHSSQFPAGIGFHNDGSKSRHHARRTSARGAEGPPGSYGLHGHVLAPKDRFEQAYYEKHPELAKKELGIHHGVLGDERAQWALSSEDLNKVVRNTASRGSGIGTSRQVIGTPDEQVGFIAAEEYASRISSPRPESGAGFHKTAHQNISETHIGSPLRKESIPGDMPSKSDFENAVGRGLQGHADQALESEFEDDDVVHVEPPNRRPSHIYGGAYADSTDNLGNSSDFIDEEVYSAPILAADEVAKDPFGYELQPAVSPLHERRGSAYDGESLHHYRTGSTSSLPGSHASSRPASIHGSIAGLHYEPGRDLHSTPLEDLDEYEPLFPDEPAEGKKAAAAADKLKGRPDFKRHKFPSQDIWEDVPSSLAYTATVSTPDLPGLKEKEHTADDDQPREGETPEQAWARRQEALAERQASDPLSFLPRDKKPWARNADLMSEVRPSLKQRFPSRDIWEDTPDSLQLQATVSTPQIEEREALSPPEERPTTGAVAFHQEKSAAGYELGEEEGRATTGIAATLKPQIPARPSKAKKPEGLASDAAQPAVPDRPGQKPQAEGPKPVVPQSTKPQVPARPAKPISKKSSEEVPLSKVASGSSVRSDDSDVSAAAAAKPKPPVPTRPLGSKIAALQGGFLSDLNKRLQIGPQAPKKEEPAAEEAEEPKEKAPLVDARKGRARGPARRAPAKSPTPAAASDSTPSKSSPLRYSTIITVYEISPEDDYVVVAKYEAESDSPPDPKALQTALPTLARHVAGEEIVEPKQIDSEAVKPSPSVPADVQDAHAEQSEEQRKEALAAHLDNFSLSPVKPSDSPQLISRAPEHDDAAFEDLAGSTGTIKAEPLVSGVKEAATEPEKETETETQNLEKVGGGDGDDN